MGNLFFFFECVGRLIEKVLHWCVKVTSKPILVYPNSGERYDPERKEWVVRLIFRLRQQVKLLRAGDTHN